MAGNALNLILPLSGPFSYANGNPAGAFTLNETTDFLAMVFSVPADLASYSLTKALFRVNTVTGTSPTFTVTLEAVSGTTGFPDGVALATVDYAAIAGDAGHIVEKTFAVAYTATAGQVLALVIRYKSGTIDGSNSIAITYSYASRVVFPYAVTGNGGTGALVAGHPIYGIKTAGSDVFGLPVVSQSSVGPNGTSATVAEAGNLFTIPTTWFSTFKLAGINIVRNGGVAAMTLTARLYSGTTLLQSGARDSDYQSGTGAGIEQFIFTDALATLATGTPYGIVLHNSGNTNYAMFPPVVEQAADMGAFPLGTSCYWQQRGSAGGAWSTTTTQRACIDLILSDIRFVGGRGGFGSPFIAPAPPQQGV